MLEFTESLKSPIYNLCSLAVTIKNIGTLVNNNKIPQGCIPTCRLGVPNAPLSLTQSWNQCLLECGKQLTAILVNHHSNSHEALLTEIKDNINNKFQSLTDEHSTTFQKSNQSLNPRNKRSLRKSNIPKLKCPIAGIGDPAHLAKNNKIKKQKNR